MTKASTNIAYYPEGSVICGHTYGSWTVRWWQWALSTPRSVNPLYDKTGKYSGIYQPANVWFLAGRFGSEERWLPKRECVIPHSRPILFPILNCEANSLEYPHLKTDEDLINHVRHDVETIIRKDCFINNERLPALRIQSDPAIFNVKISGDLFDIPQAGETTAAADGYWIFLEALDKGEYHIWFEGSCEQGRLNSGADYRIRVV